VIKKNLLDTTSLTEDKISIIYNGVDLEIFNPARANRNKLRNELNIAEDEILIGMTARFSPGKGHEEFLFAANELNKNILRSNLLLLVKRVVAKMLMQTA
jgi:Glycosyl transferases group 1.